MPGNRKKRSGKKKTAPQAGEASTASGADGSVRAFGFTLDGCSPAFWQASPSQQCPAELNVAEDRPESTPASCSGSIDATSLGDFLAWFAAGLVSEPAGKLAFSATLTKDERSTIHKSVEGRFSATLETFSDGTGEARHLAVYAKGRAPKRDAAPEDVEKASMLYKWAKDAGLSVSQDELLQQMQTSSLSAELAKLWDNKSAVQAEVDTLLQAVASGDSAAVKALLSSHPGLLKLGSKDYGSDQRLPLHAAARSGHLEVARALVEGGMQVDMKDAGGKTALQVARTFEQCDVEAVLLQLGAHDPEAKHFPINGAAAGLGLGGSSSSGVGGSSSTSAALRLPSLRADAPVFVPSFGAPAAAVAAPAPTPTPVPAPVISYAAAAASTPAAAATASAKPAASSAAPASSVVSVEPKEAAFESIPTKETAAAAAVAAAAPPPPPPPSAPTATATEEPPKALPVPAPVQTSTPSKEPSAPASSAGAESASTSADVAGASTPKSSMAEAAAVVVGAVEQAKTTACDALHALQEQVAQPSILTMMAGVVAAAGVALALLLMKRGPTK